MLPFSFVVISVHHSSTKQDDCAFHRRTYTRNTHTYTHPIQSQHTRRYIVWMTSAPIHSVHVVLQLQLIRYQVKRERQKDSFLIVYGLAISFILIIYGASYFSSPFFPSTTAAAVRPHRPLMLLESGSLPRTLSSDGQACTHIPDLLSMVCIYLSSVEPLTYRLPACYQ